MTRRVALMPAPLEAPFGRLQSAPLPSQKTWMDMMERLEAKYGPQAERPSAKKKKKKRPSKKKKRPSQKAQRAFRAKLRDMVKCGKSVTLDTSLRRLVQAFSQHGGHRRLKMWQGSAMRNVSGCSTK